MVHLKMMTIKQRIQAREIMDLASLVFSRKLLQMSRKLSKVLLKMLKKRGLNPNLLEEELHL
jgi:hypothetical protein